MRRLLLSALLAVGSFGCAPKEVNYAVKIVTQNCDASANPFEGVQFLRVKVTGDAMEPKIAPSGPFRDAADYRRRFPDGRIGSDPSQASIEAGGEIVAAAKTALIGEVARFFGENA